MNPLTITEVVTRRDRRAFVRLPWKLYAGDRHWVPPLLMDVKKRLDPRKNPFFEHGDAVLFLARSNGEPVGRIAAITNRLHDEIHAESAGFFGWFECIDDPDVAAALMDAARKWTRSRGAEILRGPVSFSTNDECGTLIEGFDGPPTFLITYNPPYHDELIRGTGLEKAMDLLSFRLVVKEFALDRIGRIIEKVKRRDGITVRNLRRDDFATEIGRIKEIYNDAWADNWGFIPMTEAEIDHMAKDLKPLLDPRLVAFVERGDETIGFSLVLPNYNEVIQKLNGRLFPFGFFKLLRGARRTNSIRMVAMGLRRDVRTGADAILYHDAFRQSLALGKEWSDLGWVLETNHVMCNTIKKIGGRVHRRHRLYAAPL